MFYIYSLSPNENVAFPMICGAVAALVSCFLVWFVKVQPKEGQAIVAIAGGH